MSVSWRWKVSLPTCRQQGAAAAGTARAASAPTAARIDTNRRVTSWERIRRPELALDRRLLSHVAEPDVRQQPVERPRQEPCPLAEQTQQHGQEQQADER